MKQLLLSIIFLFIAQFSWGQTPDSLGMQQLTVVKSFDPETAAAQKIKDQPLWDSLPKARSGGQYTYPTFGLGPVWGPKQGHQLPPLLRKTQDVHRYFASLEGGNLSGYGAEFGLNTDLSRRTQLAVYSGIRGARGSSSQLFEDQFYRDAALSLQAQSALSGALLTHDLEVNSQALNYYGFYRTHELAQSVFQTSVPIDLGVRFQTLSFRQKVQFEQGALDELAWEGTRVGDLNGFRETRFAAQGKGDLPWWSGKLMLSGGALAMWTHRSESPLDQLDPQGTGYRLGLVTFATAYVYQPKKEIRYTAGINGAYHAQAGSDRIYVFPELKATYRAPSSRFTGEMSLSGGVKTPDFNSLRQINPWLSPSSLIKPERTTYAIQLTGVWSPLDNLQFNAQLYTDRVNDMALFTLNPLNSFRSTPDALGNSFQVIYDQISSSGLGLLGQWAPWTDWNLSVSGGWRHMVTDVEAKAWNMPTAYFDGQIEGRFAPHWYWGAEVDWVNSRFDQYRQVVQFVQPGSLPSTLIELPSRLMAHTQFRYQHREQWQFSLKVNNVFQQSQTQWAQYPEMGRMILLGVQYQWDRFKF